MIKNILFHFKGWIGGFLIMSLFRLNRQKLVNSEIMEEIISSGKSIIICCWHGRLLFPFYFFRKKGFYALAGLHRDAEIISKIGSKMGWNMIRGSSSKKGKEAYEEIVQRLKESGIIVGLTPDGPKGPRLKAKRGTVRAAQETGTVIIPVSGQSNRRWEVINWDVLVIPKPFGRSVFVFGEPLIVTKNDDIDEINNELEKRLISVQEQADELIDNKI